MYAVIVENDISDWEDKTGDIYHFPNMYKSLLLPGTKVIYYKGRIKEKKFSSQRLSNAPHYFGTAEVVKVYPDERSSKADFFAVIGAYSAFAEAVSAKSGDGYFERIPDSRINNYWRSAVRKIDVDVYNSIVGSAKRLPAVLREFSSGSDEVALVSRVEGDKIKYFGERYERDPILRRQAIAFHGLECKVCGFNFEAGYGEYAKGYVHVHHVVPISQFEGAKVVSPESDMVPLCANCHAVIHRRRDRTVSIEELKAMLRIQWVSKK
ncbi:HNH endonuclease [Pseudomonas syringae]|uniref:HNH endonuclease n=1 Tax=Pseudomonas sp. Leaf127 TaxID=1736267 RepID=UPI0009EAE0D6|nr:HNH endonuclease [Pseudomonas sp. Leaf127]MBD8574696.1 HNH endonuclease [Pseudomonas syringae]MBD8789258.1 HNH endonuclease [Pseudomonas syringae]MBD8800298.1 HNH endonuclease [Pseudomonas syringae]MBD8810686.1 HNH endonuclease [Pseudomonas syringae]